MLPPMAEIARRLSWLCAANGGPRRCGGIQHTKVTSVSISSAPNDEGSPMLRRIARPIFGRRTASVPRPTPSCEQVRPAIKRSHQVSLLLLGSTALAGWQYSRPTSPRVEPQQVLESPAQPGCDRGGGLTVPGCGDGRSPTQDSTGRSTGTSSSGGHGGFSGFFHNGASPGTSEARAATGTTTFGGFGESGRAVAAHGAGG